MIIQPVVYCIIMFVLCFIISLKRADIALTVVIAIGISRIVFTPWIGWFPVISAGLNLIAIGLGTKLKKYLGSL